MSILTMGLSRFFCSCPITFKNIACIGCKFEVVWIATGSVFAKMVEYWNMFTLAFRYGLNQPSVNKSVNPIQHFINSYFSITTIQTTSPNPTAHRIKLNFLKKSVRRFWRYIVDYKPSVVHNTSISNMGTYAK